MVLYNKLKNLKIKNKIIIKTYLQHLKDLKLITKQ